MQLYIYVCVMYILYAIVCKDLLYINIHIHMNICTPQQAYFLPVSQFSAVHHACILVRMCLYIQMPHAHILLHLNIHVHLHICTCTCTCHIHLHYILRFIHEGAGEHTFVRVPVHIHTTYTHHTCTFTYMYLYIFMPQTLTSYHAYTFTYTREPARVDLLQRVVLWQQAKKRPDSKAVCSCVHVNLYVLMYVCV